MTKIYKYELPISGPVFIKTYKGAEVLCVQTQDNKPVIWLEVNTQADEAELRVWIYMTGEQQKVLGDYIGTFQLDNGCYVGHVYKV